MTIVLVRYDEFIIHEEYPDNSFSARWRCIKPPTTIDLFGDKIEVEIKRQP